MSSKFVCVHIGARAHYLIPKSLQANSVLELLITDTWMRSGTMRQVLRKVPLHLIRSLSNRYAPEIPSKQISSFTFTFLLIEVYVRLRYKDYWERILRRNNFFQKLALKVYHGIHYDHLVLGTSYTSLQIFQHATKSQIKKILFQIDPGVVEERIVADLVAKYKYQFGPEWQKAPPRYWSDWRQECSLADVILVNSKWTKDALIEDGVLGSKIKIIPLPFILEKTHYEFTRTYPQVFDELRPFRCLFLGTLTLRKGIHLVLEVAERLKSFPIEFILVGQSEINETHLNHPNIKYQGMVPRMEVGNFYREADIFLFPTFSDGFGLTQLEAMSWQLPVLSSKFCGEVVIDGFNGMILDECSSDSLAELLVKLMNKPKDLRAMSLNCLETVSKYSTRWFSESLSELF